MHSHSIFAAAVGAAGIANAMPAVIRRVPQDTYPAGYTGGNNYYGSEPYRGGEYQGSEYPSGDQSETDSPLSMLNGVVGGSGGGILPLGGSGGSDGGFPSNMLSSASKVLPLGGGGGSGPLAGLGAGLLKRTKRKAQHYGDDDDDDDDDDDEDDECEEQCGEYCNQYFDGQDRQEQQCGNWCPQACDNQSGGDTGRYKPEEGDSDDYGRYNPENGDAEQAFCTIWDQLQGNDRWGQTNDRWGQGDFGQGGFGRSFGQGFGLGPAVTSGRYGGGEKQQCPLWQQGRYEGGGF